MKKGNLSINTIIVAVLALLVLVIVIFLLSRGGTGLNEGTNCGLYGGICTDKVCNEPIYDENNQKPTCSNRAQECCKPYAIESQ